MSVEALYAYSLAPVLSVSALLLWSTLLHGRDARGLAAYCAGLAFWSGALLLAFIPGTAHAGRLLAASGTFVVAGFLHAAFDFTRQPDRRLVWLAYVAAGVLTVVGAAKPGVLYDPVSLARGPMFWPGMLAAVAAAALPLWKLWAARDEVAPERRAQLWTLAASGALCYAGAWSNALLLSGGQRLPWGLYGVLASLLLLTHVVRGHQTPAARRRIDASLLYSALAAFLSAGLLVGALGLVDVEGRAQYGVGAAFVLAMALLALDPARQQLAHRLGRIVAPDRAGPAELAEALTRAEDRADQAARLAELGTFASAVAHEVRNPLGVLAAHLKRLERAGADPSVTAEMRAQIDRASRFTDDLLRYGRPRPLELRDVDLAATAALAWSSVERADAACALPDGAAMVEADQAQMLQVLVVLMENAVQVGATQLLVEVERGELETRVVVLDDGPGLPGDLEVFEPFVTGRKRGTGLGLAIASGIVERHRGRLTARTRPEGGARFVMALPRRQPAGGVDE